MRIQTIQKANRWLKGVLPFCLFVSLPLSIQAQQETTDEEIDDDEIIVTDDEGNEVEIEFPEAMTYDLDSLLNLYMSKTYLTESGDCQTAKTNPEFPKEVYVERLSRMPTVMEMAYNDVVRNSIDRYMGRLRHSVSLFLGAANFYMPIFEDALETYQVPLELKYLPIIESALNPRAVSHAGAAGLWQFMPSTGKTYGLDINSLVDERRDPIKASFAAAHLLSDLYKVFGDWNLVIAAYNCGPENVNKAIHRAGGIRDYWKIYPYLPAETRGYVPAFIAANYAMNYYCEHNICPMRSKLPAKTDTVMVNRNVHLNQVASVLNVDIEMLRTLNPEFRRDIVPGATKPYAIRLPQADATRFIDMQDQIYNYNSHELLNKRDEVEVNDERPTYVSSRKATRSAKQGRARSSRSSAQSVTVRKGDSLSAIARRNGTTVSKLKKLNGIKGSNIRAGQRIRVR
jgi:membrane-bound lytic murein transglycosylase D